MLAFPIYYMWESLLCTIPGVFSIMTIRLFLARQKEFDAVLNSKESGINRRNIFLKNLNFAFRTG